MLRKWRKKKARREGYTREKYECKGVRGRSKRSGRERELWKVLNKYRRRKRTGEGITAEKWKNCFIEMPNGVVSEEENRYEKEEDIGVRSSRNFKGNRVDKERQSNENKRIVGRRMEKSFRGDDLLFHKNM